MSDTTPIDLLPPLPGEVWRSRSPQRTRHVMERNLGGDVFYVAGRWYRGAWRQQQCTLAEWNEWAANAKLVRRDRINHRLR